MAHPYIARGKNKKLVSLQKDSGILTQEYYWQHSFKALNKLKIGRFQTLVKRYDKVREKFHSQISGIVRMESPLFQLSGALQGLLHHEL
jgi:hypothetical protein